MTRAGFPHSDILGSRFVCQLPEAYRRLQRPSSAPSAKASTLCPYKLDHKDHSNKRCSRPLCSSQATTGSDTLTPAPTHTHPRNSAAHASGLTERYQPTATHTHPTPTGADRVRSDPERTTVTAVPSGPNSVPSRPDPQQPPFPPRTPEEAWRTRRHQLTEPATVDVPPSSTVPHSFGRDNGPGHHSHPTTGQPDARCSLERR